MGTNKITQTTDERLATCREHARFHGFGVIEASGSHPYRLLTRDGLNPDGLEDELGRIQRGWASTGTTPHPLHGREGDSRRTAVSLGRISYLEPPRPRSRGFPTNTEKRERGKHHE